MVPSFLGPTFRGIKMPDEYEAPGARFWFVGFQLPCGHVGNYCFKGHGRYLNFVSVTRSLTEKIGESVSITFWKEIPRAHYEQFQVYMNETEEPAVDKGIVLRIVPKDA